MTSRSRWRALTVGFLALIMMGAMNTAHPASAQDIRVVQELPANARLIPGEKIRITLPTNVTTGYTWIATGGCCTKDDQRVARISKGRYSAPANPQGLVGAPGETTWTITALRPGKTTFTIVTRPPGAQNTMQDEEVGTLRLTVVRQRGK
jgi:predicted secreted protein